MAKWTEKKQMHSLNAKKLGKTLREAADTAKRVLTDLSAEPGNEPVVRGGLRGQYTLSREEHLTVESVFAYSFEKIAASLEGRGLKDLKLSDYNGYVKKAWNDSLADAAIFPNEGELSNGILTEIGNRALNSAKSRFEAFCGEQWDNKIGLYNGTSK